MVAPNDHFVDRVALAGTGSIVVDFTGASFLDAGEADWWGGDKHKSLWFRWTADFTGIAMIAFGAGAPDAWDVVVFPDAATSPDVWASSYLAWSDQTGYYTFSAVAGTSYIVMADDYSYETGSAPSTAATLFYGTPPSPWDIVTTRRVVAEWVPLGAQRFSFEAHLSDYAPLGPFQAYNVDFNATRAPEVLRVTSYKWGIMVLPLGGGEHLSDGGYISTDIGYAFGFSGGSAVYVLEPENDLLGYCFELIIVISYLDGRIVTHRSDPVCYPAGIAPVRATLYSTDPASYFHTFSQGRLYALASERATPVSPGLTVDTSSGTPIPIIHAKSGAVVYIDPAYSGWSYFSFAGTPIQTIQVTGTADNSEHAFGSSAYLAGFPYIYPVLGPNLPGVAESVITLRTRDGSLAGAVHEEMTAKIVWE